MQIAILSLVRYAAMNVSSSFMCLGESTCLVYSLWLEAVMPWRDLDGRWKTGRWEKLIWEK